jgi:hypothetical protein
VGTITRVSATATDTNFANNDVLTATATCPGTAPRVISGGVQTSSNLTFQMANSWPSSTGAWTGTIVSYGLNSSMTLTVWALCIA